MNTIFLQASAASSPWGTVAMMAAIFVVFYFFMIRPQQKKQKALEEQRKALKSGDRIITSGGVHGVIKDVKEREFVIEIADGVRVRIDKGSVYAVTETAK